LSVLTGDRHSNSQRSMLNYQGVKRGSKPFCQQDHLPGWGYVRSGGLGASRWLSLFTEPRSRQRHPMMGFLRRNWYYVYWSVFLRQCSHRTRHEGQVTVGTCAEKCLHPRVTTQQRSDAQGYRRYENGSITAYAVQHKTHPRPLQRTGVRRSLSKREHVVLRVRFRSCRARVQAMADRA